MRRKEGRRDCTETRREEDGQARCGKALADPGSTGYRGGHMDLPVRHVRKGDRHWACMMTTASAFSRAENAIALVNHRDEHQRRVWKTHLCASFCSRWTWCQIRTYDACPISARAAGQAAGSH